ncbi:P-loop containing nucleoside triphosphate hydrolase protein [Ilyonectria robusta]|uniref:P-loop containing nucleoside triphosphate hydrolase protein n=1 Tax=Ilyonectria robusta TaxID=1079257 RepID=UPI001E8DC31A|nr:P-loop containing nucleoside triphosphate hydrolase protein [Ilyonectria robusta]KAH8651726.1 P-loop containing nucleoside triphosphate hydrolase protein [Ilyonectria robusta]
MMTPSSNTSPPLVQETPFQQMSILDIFFPGFSHISSTIQQLLAGDLSSYAHLMCLFGLLAFFGTYTHKLRVLLEDHFTSTVYVQRSDETYNMVLERVSSRSLDNAARSSIARVKKQRGREGHTGEAKKALSFSPWYGSFIFRHNNTFLSYRTSLRDVGFHKEEEISITCLGRSSTALKNFLIECRDEYLNLIKNKTAVFKHRNDRWERATAVDARPLSTVILGDAQKQSFIKDVEDFLNLRTRRWYSTRSMPYRRGYLLHGPPGTGKSSLSLSVAGRFGLDIYAVSVSTVNDRTLEDLFAKLPPQCVVLLEDIDAAGATHSRDAGGEIASERGKSADTNSVTLSGLLNAIDGVASQEGRLLIMTTNHIEKLDDALIRPGRVDREVKFQLVDRDLSTQIYRLVFEQPNEVGLNTERRTKDQLMVERFADEFAAKVPEHEFSPAEILSFLVQYRDSPSCALENVEDWVARTLQEKRSKGAGSCDDAMSRRDKASANHEQHLLWFLKFWNFWG